MPLFRAAVSGDVLPSQLYWRLITLDSFDGSQWRPSEQPAHHPAEGDQFRGRRDSPSKDVPPRSARWWWWTISASRTYRCSIRPVAFGSEEELLRRSFRVRADGSIRYDLLSRPGLTYEAASLIPTPTLSALATVDGELSPMFADAAEAGVYRRLAGPERPGPTGRRAGRSFLELPEIDPRIEPGRRAT